MPIASTVQAMSSFASEAHTQDMRASQLAESDFSTSVSTLLPHLLGVRAHWWPSRRRGWYLPHAGVVMPTSLWRRFADRYELPTAVEANCLDYDDAVTGRRVGMTLIGDIRRCAANINDAHGVDLATQPHVPVMLDADPTSN